MVRILVENTFVAGKRYIEAAGLSTDVKPTAGVITGSKYLAVDNGNVYSYDEVGGEWILIDSMKKEVADAVNAWLDDHPEATTTVEDGAITYQKLNASLQTSIDEISEQSEEIDNLKSAISIIDNILEVPYQRRFSGTVNASWTLKDLGTIALKNGVKYTFNFNVSSALGYTTYIYVCDVNTDTNLISSQIASDETSKTLQYLCQTIGQTVKLRFQVGVSTQTTVFCDVTTNEIDKISSIESNIETLESSLESSIELINDVNERQKENSNRVDSLTGEIAIYDNLFEIGIVDITTNGWDYHVPYWTPDEKKSRVVVKEGNTLLLNAGDIIGLSNYTDARMSIGWIIDLDNDEYGASGWKTTDFVCPITGEYNIMLSNRIPVVQTDKHDLLNLLHITRFSEIQNVIKANPLIKCINHRGFNSLAPENTIPAFKLSKKYGFEYVETDVSFTSDHVPVLMHDDTVDRTTDGTGNVWDFTYEQIEALDAGSWFSSEYAGTKVPSLEEFMTFCKKAGIKPYLEIKVSQEYTPSSTDLDNVKEIVQKTGMVEATTFICVNITPLVQMLSLLPDCRGGIISGSSSVGDNIIYIAGHDTYKLFIDTNSITDAQIATCVENGIELEYWVGADGDFNWNIINVYATGLTSNAKRLADYWYNVAMNM